MNNGKRIPQFTCSAYSKTPVGTLCSTQHRVVADVVMTLIKESLKAIIQFSQEDEAEFEKVFKDVITSQQTNDEQAQRARWAVCRRRVDELETLLCKIYEDNALGKLPDKRYQLLINQYETETSALEAEISTLEDILRGYAKNERSAGKFMELVRKYKDFEELTTPMLIEFIDKILIHERDIKGAIDSPQTIEIYFNFIGKFEVPKEKVEQTPEEIELAARKERTRQKRHDAYVRRKETGWQSIYYWKTKRAKKEAMNAMKEELRAEDRANGVYYLPNAPKEEPQGVSV